ncbi:TonB-dependent receptor [bacterium]|nr:TonB-dependent receptor [bacterium]
MIGNPAKSKGYKMLMLFVLFFIVQLPLSAQEEIPEIKVEVQVEAEKAKPIGTASVTSERAEEMAAIQNISDVLTRLPGLEGLYGCVMSSPRLTIRSSSFASRQVLVEGINVNPIISCVLDRVPWTSIQKVDVLKAPLPPQFIGSLSGAVLVSLKNGYEYPGAFFSTGFGSYNTQMYQLSAGGGNETKNYFIAFNRTTGNEWREKMRTDLSDLSFKLINGTKEEKFTIVGTLLQGEQAGFTPTGPNPADRWGQRWPAMLRFGTSLTYEKQLKEGSSILFRLSPVTFRSELHYYQWDQSKLKAVPMITLLRYNLLRSELHYQFSTSQSIANALGFWWQGDWRRSTVPTEEPQLGIWRKQDMNRKGAYFQRALNFKEGRSFILGLGYEEANLGGTAIVPFASYNWMKRENAYRIAIGRNKLFPTLEELYGGGCFIGNPNLKPTVANSVQIDWERNLGNAKLTASLFFSKEENLIGNDKEGKYYNIGKVSEQGMELAWEKQLGRTSLWANYTYLDAWDIDHDRTLVPTYRTAEPRHSLKMGVTYNSRDNLTYSAELFYWGERATDSDGKPETWYGAPGGPIQIIVPRSVPSATILNLKVSKRFSKDRNISLSIQNLFDKDWQEVVFYPQAGRTFLFEYSQQF